MGGWVGGLGVVAPAAAFHPRLAVPCSHGGQSAPDPTSQAGPRLGGVAAPAVAAVAPRAVGPAPVAALPAAMPAAVSGAPGVVLAAGPAGAAAGAGAGASVAVGVVAGAGAGAAAAAVAAAAGGGAGAAAAAGSSGNAYTLPSNTPIVTEDWLRYTLQTLAPVRGERLEADKLAMQVCPSRRPLAPRASPGLEPACFCVCMCVPPPPPPSQLNLRVRVAHGALCLRACCAWEGCGACGKVRPQRHRSPTHTLLQRFTQSQVAFPPPPLPPPRCPPQPSPSFPFPLHCCARAAFALCWTRTRAGVGGRACVHACVCTSFVVPRRCWLRCQLDSLTKR
jgi:hypothetical protein